MLDSREFTRAVREWAQEVEEFPEDDGKAEPCTSPFCPLKESNLNIADSSCSVMKMMVVGGGDKSKPPAKSFFDLIDITKKKNAVVRRIIMTDPFIYADIGESGSAGGFKNLVLLLKHLNIDEAQKFGLELSPRANDKKKSSLQKMLKTNFSNCILSSHRNKSIFHDRFILAEYDDGECRAWYGPSLNGLNSDSVVIFGDVTQASALKQLSSKLVN